MPSLEQIPQPKGDPLIGTLRAVDAETPMQSFMRLARIHGPIFQLDFIGKPLIFMDSRAVLHVMHYLDRRFVLDDWRVIGSATTALSVVENHGGYMVSAGYARKIARGYAVRCIRLVEPEVRMTLSLYFATAAPAQQMLRAAAQELAGCIAQLLRDQD